jgi:hypothetical protein
MPVKAPGASSCYGAHHEGHAAMYTRTKPDWILIANPKRARVLQHEPGCAMSVVESFVHPAGRGQTSAMLAPGEEECTAFAREVAHYLEQEARRDRFRALSICAREPFAHELCEALGRFTQALLSGVHEADLTSCAVAELEQRISREMALAEH